MVGLFHCELTNLFYHQAVKKKTYLSSPSGRHCSHRANGTSCLKYISNMQYLNWCSDVSHCEQNVFKGYSY